MDVDDTRPSALVIELPNSPSLPKFEEVFIMLLETLPELWNTQHKHYTNKYKRQAGYKKLLGVFRQIKPQATVDDVRKKINSLRSNYRRELKKITASIRSGASADDVYTPKAKTFKLLSFLYSTEEPNNSQQCLNYEELTEHSDSSPENVKESVNPLQETSFSPINQVVHPLKNNKKPKNLLAKQNDLINRANLFLTQSALQSQKSMQEATTSHSLALVWAEKLDKLHPQQRFFAEKAIHDILFEAGLGNLNRFSVKVNESNMNMGSGHYNASPMYSHNPNAPIPNCSSPENSVINTLITEFAGEEPPASDRKYSPVAPSHSPSPLNHPHTSASKPSHVAQIK